MGQQPNIELEIADLPRPTPNRSPERRWRPRRPGELTTPEEVPWGGAFGTTGPDTGYALRLLAGKDIPLAPGEKRESAEAALVALAGARASHFGRAPTPTDIDVAMTILGYLPDELPEELIGRLAAERQRWLAGIGHAPEKARELVAAVPIESLAAPLEDLRARMAEGELLILR